MSSFPGRLDTDLLGPYQLVDLELTPNSGNHGMQQAQKLLRQSDELWSRALGKSCRSPQRGLSIKLNASESLSKAALASIQNKFACRLGESEQSAVHFGPGIVPTWFDIKLGYQHRASAFRREAHLLTVCFPQGYTPVDGWVVVIWSTSVLKWAFEETFSPYKGDRPNLTICCDWQVL